MFEELFTFILIVLFGDRVTRARGSSAEIRKRFPGSTVRRAEIAHDWAATVGLQQVEFVVGNRRQLSFRDGYSHEELRWTAAEVDRFEPVATPGFAGRRIRVVGTSGETLTEFWSPDSEGDVLTDLTAALRR